MRRRRWPIFMLAAYLIVGLALYPAIRFHYELEGPVRWVPMTLLWPVEVIIWIKDGAHIDLSKRGPQEP